MARLPSGKPLPGKLFVVEGIDGSGKSTQLDLLRKWLIGEGYCVAFSEWNSSPVVRATTKRGKKKRGPQNRGSHLALELLGFVNKVFSDLAYHAVQLALLAPSFEVASRILKSEGANLSVNKIRGLVKALFPSKLSKRVELPLEKGGETLKDCRVLIEPDGGRLRQRKTKKGRIPKGNKRNGYHTDWIEPKLFIIHVLDKNGRPIKQIPPVIDGTTGKLPDLIELLREYLVQLKISEAKEVILAGDGAPWIWDRIPKLLEEVGVSENKITQILDWTHAKQNLYEAFDKLPKKKKAKNKVDIQYFKDLLFGGMIDKMVSEVKKIFNVNSASRIVKKFKSYFIPNSSRMQYKNFEHRKMPIGSGAIESAIRRVLNLRLKSPGSFWKLGFAEAMIYLRAQLLSGRWKNLKINRVISLHQNFALLAMN